MAASEIRPVLKLIDIERIRFHEHAERRRTLKLMQRIREEALLRNPPIVGGMPGGDFLLLDGANRVSAFKELGYSHVPVQVVDYGHESVQLKGWHHLLLNGRGLNLRSRYSALPGISVQQVEREQLAMLLEFRRVFTVLVDESTQCWGLFPAQPGPVTVQQRIATLNRVIAAYEGQSQLERIKLADYSQLPQVIRSLEHQLCLFPVLTKEELLSLAVEGVMIPTGLTRHLIPGRALAINLELAFLKDLSGAEAKIAHFERHMAQLETQGRIRFYEESVFIMNE